MSNHESKCANCHTKYDDEMFSEKDSSVCIWCSGEDDETEEEDEDPSYDTLEEREMDRLE